jgi:four helix bundle protein
VRQLPSHPETPVISRQLLRAGTGVGSQYRAACRAKSRSDFIAKITSAEEEADESAYWMELLVESESVPEPAARELLAEAGELTAIFVSSARTARGNRR